jgi:tetratricopeptide (TPR) repeat protein
LRQAIQIEPQLATSYIHFSYALDFQGDTVGGAAAARKALGLNPNNASAHDALGLALETEGKFEQAATEYREAVRLSPPGYTAFMEHLERATHKNATARSEVSVTSGDG